MPFSHLFPLPQLEHAIDRDPLRLSPDCSVLDAIALMSQATGGNCAIACDLADSAPAAEPTRAGQKSCVLVMEADRICGIFTERDLVRLTTLGKDLAAVTLRQVMSQPAIVLQQTGSQTLFHALSLFRQHQIRHLPVLDDRDRLLGVVTSETVWQVLQPLNLLKWRRVEEVMTMGVVCASPIASVLALAHQMAQHQVSCVVIVAALPDAPLAAARSQPLGVVTERDIVQFQTLGLDLAKIEAATVMSAPLFAVRPADLLITAHQEMQQRRVRRLVVTGDRGELLGIITQTSLLRILDSTELYGVVHLLQASVQERTVELRQALQKQRDLNELKSRFVAMASHDLRNPLGTILCAADLLECYSGSPDKQAPCLDRIRAAAKHMNQLLNDLLTIGQVESGKLVLEPAPIDLVWFCMSLVEELKLGRGVEQEIHFTSWGGELNPCLDEKLLRQILTNLLTNAVKYSPPASPIEFDLRYQPGQVTFTIQDHGIGIPDADQPQLFESFHRAQNVGTVPGTGLGLAIVKRCVDLHQGTIAVSSQVEKGTTVAVTLPSNLCGFPSHSM